jgi:hypothetical protein
MVHTQINCEDTSSMLCINALSVIVGVEHLGRVL